LENQIRIKATTCASSILKTTVFKNAQQCFGGNPEISILTREDPISSGYHSIQEESNSSI